MCKDARSSLELIVIYKCMYVGRYRLAYSYISKFVSLMWQKA